MTSPAVTRGPEDGSGPAPAALLVPCEQAEVARNTYMIAKVTQQTELQLQTLIDCSEQHRSTQIATRRARHASGTAAARVWPAP